MKLFTSIMAILMAASLYANPSYAATEVTDQNYKQTLEKAVNNGDKVVLVFYATWCPNCKIFDPMVEKFEKANPDVKVMRVDVDKNPRLGAPINAIPFTVVFKGKKAVAALPGRAPSQESLNSSLKKALGK